MMDCVGRCWWTCVGRTILQHGRKMEDDEVEEKIIFIRVVLECLIMPSRHSMWYVHRVSQHLSTLLARCCASVDGRRPPLASN